MVGQRHGCFFHNHAFNSPEPASDQPPCWLFGGLQGPILVRSGWWRTRNLGCSSEKLRGLPWASRSRVLRDSILNHRNIAVASASITSKNEASLVRRTGGMVATLEKLRGKIPKVPVDQNVWPCHRSRGCRSRVIAARHHSLMP